MSHTVVNPLPEFMEMYNYLGEVVQLRSSCIEYIVHHKDGTNDVHTTSGRTICLGKGSTFNNLQDYMTGYDAETGLYSEDLDNAIALLGKQVIVTLECERANKPAVVARGLLLSVEDSGQIVTADEMGFVSYSWPMLEIEEA